MYNRKQRSSAFKPMPFIYSQRMISSDETKALCEGNIDVVKNSIEKEGSDFIHRSAYMNNDHKTIGSVLAYAIEFSTDEIVEYILKTTLNDVMKNGQNNVSSPFE